MVLTADRLACGYALASKDGTDRHPPSGIGPALAHGHNSLLSEISLCLRQGLRLNQKTLSFVAALGFR